MNTQSKISTGSDIGFVIAVFNGEATIERAIESIVRQKNSNWELVVVDDGSTDGTSDIVRKYQEQNSRIRLVQQENQGLAAARNNGFGMLTSNWTAYLDADDELVETHCEHMMQIVNKYPGHMLYGCNVLYRYPEEEFIAHANDEIAEITLADWSKGAGVALCGALISSEFYREIGGYQSFGKYGEDLNMLLCVLLDGSVIVSPEPLYIYYKGVDGQQTLHRSDNLKSCLRVIDHVRRTRNLSPLQRRTLAKLQLVYRRDITILFVVKVFKFIPDAPAHMWHLLTKAVTTSPAYRKFLDRVKRSRLYKRKK
ncbi:MAG: glycosyltransferase family 2 protein [Coriobacteriia bacterium]|nr:glycosyltransferase family 2 protein [Coriobacteriia bacterium]